MLFQTEQKSRKNHLPTSSPSSLEMIVSRFYLQLGRLKLIVI